MRDPAIHFDLYPMRGRVPAYVALAAITAAWLFMMVFSFSSPDRHRDAMLVLLEACAALLAAGALVHMNGLARAAEVLGKQQMPRTKWLRWMHVSLIELSLVWGLLSVAMAVLLASRPSSMHWLGGPALLSFILSIAALGALSRTALLPARLGAPAAIGLLAVLALNGLADSVRWVLQLPGFVLAALALCWPLLALALMVRWRRHPPAWRWSPAAPSRKLLARIAAQVARYTPLVWESQLLYRGLPAQATLRKRFIWLAAPVVYFNLFLYSLPLMTWDQEPDMRHLLGLVVLCMLTTCALVARDLHWRSMLLPGGLQRGRIASSIFASTLTVQFGFAILWAAASLGIDVTFRGIPFEAALFDTAAKTLVLFEIAVATGAALVLRAMPCQRILGWALAAPGLGCLLYLRFGIDVSTLSRWPAGGMLYAAAMAALTWGLVRLADRMWTFDKLVALGRSK